MATSLESQAAVPAAGSQKNGRQNCSFFSFWQFFFFVVVFHSDAQVERQPSVDMAEMTEKQVEIAKCSFFFFGLRLSDSSWCV